MRTVDARTRMHVLDFDCVNAYALLHACFAWGMNVDERRGRR